MQTVTIPAHTTAKAILSMHKPPRGATHFRYTEDGRNPVIDRIQNIDTLAGCSGRLEFGKVTFEGRGRHARIKEFTAMSPPEQPSNAAPEEARPSSEGAPGSQIASIPKAGKPRKNKIHGFSACAVAKALGAAGVKFAEADQILRAHGIQMPKASLSVQLGFGRNPATWERHGKPADLTPEQIAALRLVA